MIHAYDKVYLEKARTSLARMLDFAVYDLHYDIKVFFDMFINSGIAARFEKGDFRIIAGKSGIELAYDVAEISGDDIRQFTDKMKELYKSAKPDTNLKIIRNKLKLTQKELSELSGVPVRTIQQYEQRQKNINKAQTEYLVMLSKALSCKVEDLLEYV